jgi:elongation factor G
LATFAQECLDRAEQAINGRTMIVCGVRYLEAVLEAHVPLKEMFGYIGRLRALTSGRGQYSMQFSHYSPTPASVANDVIER